MRGSRQVAIDAPVARRDPRDLPHDVFNGERSASAEPGEKGIASAVSHAARLWGCKTRPNGLDTGGV